MNGPQPDVEGNCNEALELGDDYGDNVCTIKCQLEPGHTGAHQEEFVLYGKKVTITWAPDA